MQASDPSPTMPSTCSCPELCIASGTAREGHRAGFLLAEGLELKAEMSGVVRDAHLFLLRQDQHVKAFHALSSAYAV